MASSVFLGEIWNLSVNVFEPFVNWIFWVIIRFPQSLHLSTATCILTRPPNAPEAGKRVLSVKVFFRLFPVDKTLLYENPYDRVWGVLGNSSYKPFYNDLSPLENISNLCVSHFSWKQSKQWTIVGYIYYMIYVTQYIHKKVWWNVFQMMGYAPL